LGEKNVSENVHAVIGEGKSWIGESGCMREDMGNTILYLPSKREGKPFLRYGRRNMKEEGGGKTRGRFVNDCYFTK